MAGPRENSSDPVYAGTIVQEFFQEVTEYAIFLLDSNGNVASWNEGAERIKGYERDEILGTHFSVFYLDDSDSDAPERALSLAERDGSYEEKGWRVRKDGSQIWAQVTIRALYDESGTLNGFAEIVRDITETRDYQEQLERSRDRLERTEQLADVGGWELNFEPRAISVTDGARQLLDVPNEEELTIRDVVAFVHDDDRELLEDAVERARQSGESFNVELRIITAKGRKRWVQLRGEAVEGTDTVRGAVRDISARKEHEERLMVLNRVLRHNLRNNLNVVTGYANKLQNDLEELEHASMADGDLTHLLDVFDDLSETTAGIRSELAALTQTVSAVDEFETQSAVRMTERIIENAEDLMSTGEKARAFEQVMENEVEQRAIPVHDTLSQLQTTYQRKHPHSEINVVGGEAQIFGDQGSLRLALDELVHNAIVHNDRESPTVELATRRVSTERVVITVKDDGPGIPETEQEILKQGKETALTHGSGMGLWTVHWVVTQLGGDVSITSRDTGGSTVAVLLPAPPKIGA
ncbi:MULTISPECIES: PAS domain S-box protein [Haloferax]|uniref:histidine kinase n=2 Tax=Haloferax TaxID=2251 RepID=A0A6G1Z2A1_9EURY|nr:MULTISPECIES: PAS domain S-box protein [Haloferax]KAB1187878.1 PAS domain S-box protein [Haloferax sp. CBA1149]MRW80541.1 PAS domain S-box protein [Haloferax marinisediminis]